MLITETARLVIRRFTAGDVAAMEAVFSDAEVMRYSENGAEPPATVRTRINGTIVSYATSRLGMWAIAEKPRGDVIGYVSLMRSGNYRDPGEAELGFRLARRYWGRGYATEAAGAAVGVGFDALLLARIVAAIDPQNEASARVARKIGMILQGETMMPGYTHADHLYVIARPTPATQ